MPADGPGTCRRYERVKNARANFDARWEEMAPYIAPSCVGIQTSYSPGQKQTRNVYDSTTLMAAELMAHFITGELLPANHQWLGYRPRRERTAQVDEVREWMEESRDRGLKWLAASKFYQQAPEALIDCGG